MSKIIDEIENEMSKIIKNKKTNGKPQNFKKKKYFTYQYFFKRTFRIFQKPLVKISNPSNKIVQKIP